MFVLTAFTLTALDYRSTGDSSAFDAVRRGSDTVFGPAQRALGGATHAIGSFFGGISHVGREQDEIAKLRDDNDKLRAQLRETDSLRRQIAEWNALLDLKDSSGYTLKPAHVISVGSSLGFEWTATIDAGSRDGVKVNATVVNGKGLVGRVKRVGPYTSTVLLVVDGDFSVGVRLIRSGQLGLATGHGVTELSYQLIGQRARAEVGEAMYTSGSTLKAGIPVGRVATTSNDPNSPTLTGTLTPYVDVTALELVGVVLDDARRAPRPALRPTPLPSPRPSPSPAPSPSPSRR
ncbi:MAG: rod shape-determining protein MreC [Actinomycetota bacterium]|jgi:rod shape-determining protein MreC|nr:rod shape-determining protein MreC [Actinomycetota bacterium]